MVQRVAGKGARAAGKAAGDTSADVRTSSLEKMLGLLDYFTSDAPVWSAEDLMRASSSSRSTFYRYLKTLTRSGLLAPVENGSYVLGPRILELDRQIRLNDPLYTAGLPVLRALSAETGHTSILCVLFSNSVMCIHQEYADGAPEGLLSRGERRPLLLGAASKIILAHLPPHQIRGMFAKHGPAIEAAGLGADWTAFKSNLRAMRESGLAMTTGEVRPGIFGVSAPIFNRWRNVLGSVGIALEAHLVDDDLRSRLCERVANAGRDITERVGASRSMMDLSARAIG